MIQDIRLQFFRSYVDETFELGSAVNIIVGPNASGKTNLLEAILVIARGNSFRAKDMELLQFEAPWARLDASTDTGQRTIKWVTHPVVKKTFILDDKPFQRLSMQKSLPVVVFEPNHLLLLTGSPDMRRSYLDDLLEQMQPTFGPVRRQYKRVLAQRNALLKRGLQLASPQMFAWNIRLSELGGHIARARQDLIITMNKTAEELYEGLSHLNVPLELQYESRFNTNNYESELIKKLESNLALEVERGFTAYGPHRDDLKVMLKGHPAEETASRGETRTLVLMLKLLEVQLLEASRDQTPLLLLDDVFSELDGRRRQALTCYLKKYQTFITTTDADVVIQHFMDQCTIIPLGSQS